MLEDSLVFATKGKSEKAKLIEMARKLAGVRSAMGMEAGLTADRRITVLS